MVKIAVVGTGYWGQNLVRTHYNIGSLKTICDINLAALKSIQGQYPPSFLKLKEVANDGGLGKIQDICRGTSA